MGLSKSKSKSKTSSDPWAPAQPYILKGLEQSGRVFDSQQPELEKYAGMQRDTYGRMAPGAEAGIIGAQGVVNDTLGGKNLNGNPYLDKMLDLTRANTINGVDSQFSAAGRYGSGSHANILAKAIADAENNARFQNYAMERQNQIGAVGQAGQLMAGSQSLLNNAADLPWVGVGALNGNVRQASNGYGTQTSTQTQSQPWGQMLMGAAGAGLNAYAMNPAAFSDRRMKTNIELLRRDPDGLGWYRFAYKSDPKTMFEGVMADEVKELRPKAYIPDYLGSGYDGVNYAELSQ